MSQSEFTARRPEATAAANGCDIFLWEQRIDNNCRILLTMDFISTETVPGRFTLEAPRSGKF